MLSFLRSSFRRGRLPAFGLLVAAVPLGIVYKRRYLCESASLPKAGEEEYGNALLSASMITSGFPDDEEENNATESAISEDTAAPGPLYISHPRCIARENLEAVTAGASTNSSAVSFSSSSAASPSECLYALRQHRPASPRFVCREEDVEPLSKDVSVVAITRGCAPALAAAIAASITAAAAGDREGYTFYIISDSTPDEVATAARRR